MWTSKSEQIDSFVEEHSKSKCDICWSSWSGSFQRRFSQSICL